MPKPILTPQTICQVAIVVEDIDAASQAWANIFGVSTPPWHQTAPLAETHAEYYDEPTAARAKLAFFDLGQIRLELIEPDEEPSTWREFLDTYGPGIHHIAFTVQDMEETIARLDEAGVPLVQKGDYTGGCYAYCDGLEQLGATLELLANR